MEKISLNYAQSICAARVFLNTFGLILEDVNEIDASSKIGIFDSNTNRVGELHFEDMKVLISAEYYDNASLVASYFIPTIYLSYNIHKWTSDIDFSCSLGSKFNICGRFPIESFINDNMEFSCYCHPSLEYTIPGKEVTSIGILNDDGIFKADTKIGDYHEEINVNPMAIFGKSISHIITVGPYNNGKDHWPYYREFSVTAQNNAESNEGELVVSTTETANSIDLLHQSKVVKMISSPESRETLDFKSLLAFNPRLHQSISRLSNNLTLWGSPILDYMLSNLNDYLDDTAFYFLLGIDKTTVPYQNGANNISDAYFGTAQNKEFLTKQQKALIRGNNN